MNPTILMIITALFIFFGIVAVFGAILKNKEENKYNDLGELKEKELEDESVTRKRYKVALIIGLLALVLAGVIFYIAAVKGDVPRSSNNSDNDSFPIASFIPIWVAVFVPLMVNKNKKQAPLKKNQKILILSLVLGLFLLLGISFFFIFR